MHSDMIMAPCKLVSLRSIANERVMPQYRAISKMTKLCCIISKVFVSWSNHLKNLLIPMRWLCSRINTSNQNTPSNLILQCERNLISSKEQLCLKNHHRLRNMPLCKVHQMKYTNHVSCSNVKGCLISFEGWPLLKNPLSNERSIPWHNGHLKKSTPNQEKCTPMWCIKQNGHIPNKNSLTWLCPSVGSYHNS